MNLATKIYKFKKAVWDYRGKYDPTTKRWSKLPSDKAKIRVIKGLRRLKINLMYPMALVDNLKSKNELDEWIREIIKERAK